MGFVCLPHAIDTLLPRRRGHRHGVCARARGLRHVCWRPTYGSLRLSCGSVCVCVCASGMYTCKRTLIMRILCKCMLACHRATLRALPRARCTRPQSRRSGLGCGGLHVRSNTLRRGEGCCVSHPRWCLPPSPVHSCARWSVLANAPVSARRAGVKRERRRGEGSERGRGRLRVRESERGR